MLSLVIITCFAYAIFLPQSEGGVCVDNTPGYRSILLTRDMSLAQCCAKGAAERTSVCLVEGVAEQLLNGTPLFLLEFYADKVDCKPCPTACGGQMCAEDQVCVERANGRHKCMCQLECTKSERQSGAVCTQQGETYSSKCQMKRRLCASQQEDSLMHYGSCGLPCQAVKCAQGLYCVNAHNGHAACLPCPSCLNEPENPVCGSDGVTYPSQCQMLQDKCRLQLDVLVAYRGSCDHDKSCRDVDCGQDGRCVLDDFNSPLCVACDIDPCPEPGQFDQVCATNGETYASRCQLAQALCNGSESRLIKVRKAGVCRGNHHRHQARGTRLGHS